MPAPVCRRSGCCTSDLLVSVLRSPEVNYETHNFVLELVAIDRHASATSPLRSTEEVRTVERTEQTRATAHRGVAALDHEVSDDAVEDGACMVDRVQRMLLHTGEEGGGGDGPE